MKNTNECQKLVVKNIITSNLLITEQVADAIKTTTEIGAVSLGTAGAGGATFGLGALGAVGGMTAGIGLLVLGGVVAIGSAGYGIDQYVQSRNFKESIDDAIKDYVRDIEENIWLLYFKDEIRNSRKKGDEWFTFNRDNEAIDSYIKYLQESIIEPSQENNSELIQKLTRYKQKVIDYIKPECIVDFHKELRIWCAYHKVGEFTPKSFKKGSKHYNERERIKKEIYSCFKDELIFESMNDLEKFLWVKNLWRNRFKQNKDGTFTQDEKGDFMEKSESFKEAEFQIIREKIERVYKVIEYFKSEGKELDEQKINNVVSDLGGVVLNKIKPEKMQDFQMLFRKFRYLNQECDFSRENVLQSRFYNIMYGYKVPEWNDSKNGSSAKNLTNHAVIIAGWTFVLEMTVVGVVLTGIECANFTSTLEQACQLGEQSACNSIIKIQSFKNCMNDSITMQMMGGFI